MPPTLPSTRGYSAWSPRECSTTMVGTSPGLLTSRPGPLTPPPPLFLPGVPIWSLLSQQMESLAVRVPPQASPLPPDSATALPQRPFFPGTFREQSFALVLSDVIFRSCPLYGSPELSSYPSCFRRDLLLPYSPSGFLIPWPSQIMCPLARPPSFTTASGRPAHPWLSL